MATKLVALTRVSLVSSRNPATKRRHLKHITWEVVKPTGNDIEVRQLLKYVETHPFLNRMKQKSWTLDALATVS
jgi:hypothetical protein